MARFRFNVCTLVVWLSTGWAAFGDVLQVGNRFPDLAFLGADGGTESFEKQLGKRSVVFVFASW